MRIKGIFIQDITNCIVYILTNLFLCRRFTKRIPISMGTMLTTASIVLKKFTTLFIFFVVLQKGLYFSYNLDFASLLVPCSKQY